MRPLEGSLEQALAEPLPVSKSLTTRRIALSDDDTFGCEAELADIEVPGGRAWTLCFETFGASGRREVALRTGIGGVVEKPLPNGVAFGEDTSIHYPDWITRLAYHPGKFLNAAHDKASEDNERQSFRIETP